MQKDIYLAGGCFWGTEHYFKQIKGVLDTEVGFANGHTVNPSYEEVYTDETGYAETVHIKYNPNVVSLEFLLHMFFKAIDPTSLNKQGHDEGTRYRTGIYYTHAEDLNVIEKVFSEEQKNYQEPLVVEKLPLQNFYTAEEYHQDYLDKNPDGYCHLPQSLFEFARKARFVLLMLICGIMMSCGDSNARYVKKAINIMDENGIYAHGPEWEKAKSAALAAHPTTLEEAQEIVIQAGKMAGGKHTFLMTSGEVTDNDTSVWEMPAVVFPEENIAVVKLPPFSGNEEEGIHYANTVLNALPDALDGVIIDLRGNRGGNMYPMISAVHRFLPNDIILQLRTRRGKMDINVGYVLNVARVTRKAAIDCPVALLTDEWTGSSGEAVLLCFRGLEKARTFGASTAGYASCNQPFKLPDGSQLVLTTGIDVARTGEEFCDDPIQPDVATGTPLEDALKWLEQPLPRPLPHREGSCP